MTSLTAIDSSGSNFDDKIWQAAQVVHEALSALSSANGQPRYPHWADAPDWMRESSVKSVQWAIAHPSSCPSEQHEQWVRQKKQSGWRFGPTRDDDLKQHPMLVPYDQLPIYEKQKDKLISAIVVALID